jgi:hypothetical protein
MSRNLTIYLNDHLAGSVAALELVDRLIETYKGKPLEQFFRDLRSEIAEDQGELQDLIEKLGEKESPVRKAGYWLYCFCSATGSVAYRLRDLRSNRRRQPLGVP